MTSVNGTLVLGNTNLDLFQSIVGYPFKGRPTIQMMLVSGQHVMVVRSALASADDAPILPQGGIKQDKERTLMESLLREGGEELGFNESCFDYRHRLVLGEFLNPIPDERRAKYKGATHKHCIVVAASVRNRNWVRLNQENMDHIWVDSGEHLMSLIGQGAEKRPVKFHATCAAIRMAHAKGILPWSCSSSATH